MTRAVPGKAEQAGGAVEGSNRRGRKIDEGGKQRIRDKLTKIQ